MTIWGFSDGCAVALSLLQVYLSKTELLLTVVLLQAPLVTPSSPFSPVRIGNIYQKFGSLESGLCQNIIKASVPFVLEEGMSTYATGRASDVSAFL